MQEALKSWIDVNTVNFVFSIAVIIVGIPLIMLYYYIKEKMYSHRLKKMAQMEFERNNRNMKR